MKKLEVIRRRGFTLVEIMIVVAIIGLLAAIGIANFVRARETAQTNACINNLRVIDEAKQQWALETGQLASATPVSSDIISGSLRQGDADMPHREHGLQRKYPGTGSELQQCHGCRWRALRCFAFLSYNVFCKRFGPKARS